MSPYLLNLFKMILKEDIWTLIGDYLQQNSLFPVDITISKENDIEVTIDSFGRVDIANCVAISKIIEQGFDRESEDYSLTVTSAGLDQAFKVFEQYKKFLNKDVEVVLKNGRKQTGLLTRATEEEIELTFYKLEKIEGKKKKEKIEVVSIFPLSDIKSTKPFINFK